MIFVSKMKKNAQEIQITYIYYQLFIYIDHGRNLRVRSIAVL